MEFLFQSYNFCTATTYLKKTKNEEQPPNRYLSELLDQIAKRPFY
jgi:hypothetical protein